MNLPVGIAKDRGTVAGNGGKMAVQEQQAVSVKASRRKTTAATRKRDKKRTPPKPIGVDGIRKPRTPKKPKPTLADLPELKPGESGNWLLKAINQQVVIDSERLAKAMVNKVIHGDTSGARLLADLTGAKAQSSQQPKKQRNRFLPSSAKELATQPKWHTPRDPESDTGFGGLEPEN